MGREGYIVPSGVPSGAWAYFPDPASGVFLRTWQTVGTWMWETAANGEGCGRPIEKLKLLGEGSGSSPETPHPPVWPLLFQSKAIVKEKPLPREEKEETALLVSSRLQTLQDCPNTG